MGHKTNIIPQKLLNSFNGLYEVLKPNQIADLLKKRKAEVVRVLRTTHP